MENIVLTESTYYIMLALYRPAHGYGIMQKVEEFSDGRVKLAPGTLYGALNSLVEKGWIEMLPVDEGSRKKDYQLTKTGVSVLAGEIRRLKELWLNGEEIVQEDE